MILPVHGEMGGMVLTIWPTTPLAKNLLELKNGQGMKCEQNLVMPIQF